MLSWLTAVAYIPKIRAGIAAGPGRVGSGGGGPAPVSIRLRSMNVPEQLRYSSDHEWVSRDGDVVRVGITDYAQDALGDVVFVQVPTVGADGRAPATRSARSRARSRCRTSTPRSTGTVVDVNEALADAPQSLNEDPYGDGWICTIRMSEPGEFDALLDAAAYQALIEG